MQKVYIVYFDLDFDRKCKNKLFLNIFYKGNLIHKRIRVPEVDFHGFDPNMIPIIPENV